jgi:nucleoside phosphorylase
MSTAKYHRPGDRDAFHIAIFCALRIESDAVEILFDEFWEDEEQYGKAPGDPNSYTLGRIGQHNVVLAYMPEIGKGAAAGVAAGFRSSFARVRLGLVVGICGGVPHGATHSGEILLGDVVVSTGVVQFDFGRLFSDRVIRKDTLQDNLGRPNPEIRSFLNKMQGWRARTALRGRISEYVAEICNKEGFQGWRYPGLHEDKLYEATYRHRHQDLTVCAICAQCVSETDAVCETVLNSSCAQLRCSDGQLVTRNRLEQLRQASLTTDQAKEALKPAVHFGLMASGDVVMKSGPHRDRIAAEEDVIAFEMEGAGVWDSFPTVVIKGVCDYADSHKNKKWQAYAAATAAACAKGFLREWRGFDQASPAATLSHKTSERQNVETGRQRSEPEQAQQSNQFSGTFISAGAMSINDTINSGGGPIYIK